MSRRTGTPTWLALVVLLDKLLAADWPPAIGAPTRIAARRLAEALRRELERPYPSREARAAAWGVSVPKAHRYGL